MPTKPPPPPATDLDEEDEDDFDYAYEIVHVYPNFGREHITDHREGECWCYPLIEQAGDGYVVIHNVPQ